MVIAVMSLVLIAGGASYFVGENNAGTTTSTTTSINFQTITHSVTQSITQITTSVQFSTSTVTTTVSPVSFVFTPQPKTGQASNFTRLFNTPLPAGARVRFINFTTTDGLSLNGALVEPQNNNPATTFAILAIHGRAANYTNGMINFFASRLVSYGYAFLAINTRGHDNNAFKDNFDGTYNDLGAGFAILKSLGYSNIILMGWSFGGMQVPAFAAVTHDPAIKALVLVEPVANLAAKAQYGCAVVYKDPALCGKIYSDAKSLMSQGKPYAILPESVPQAWFPQLKNMSAIHYITNWSPEATPTTTFIRHVSVPVFIGRVPSDVTVIDSEAQWLLNNATAPGSQVPSAKYVLIPDPTGKAGHTIQGVSVQLAYADAIHQWLQGQKIGP